MALLIGIESNGASTKNYVKEKEFAGKFEALATGTLEEIEIRFASLSVESEFDVGIYEDTAGKPLKLLAHKKSAKVKTTDTKVKVSGFSVSLTSGTTYHLAGVCELGTVTGVKYTKTAGKEQLEKNNTAVKELGELGVWSGEAESETPSLAGFGKEEGIVKGKATGSMLLTGTATGTRISVVAGKATGALLLTGTAKGTAAQKVEGKATGALLLTGTSHGQVAGTVFGKATGAMLLTGTSTGSWQEPRAGKATGVLTLTGTAKGTASEPSAAEAHLLAMIV